jgi:hypothetical protein
MLGWLKVLVPKNKTIEIIEHIKANNAIIPHVLHTSKGVIHIFIKEDDFETFKSLNLKEV